MIEEGDRLPDDREWYRVGFPSPDPEGKTLLIHLLLVTLFFFTVGLVVAAI